MGWFTVDKKDAGHFKQNFDDVVKYSKVSPSALMQDYNQANEIKFFSATAGLWEGLGNMGGGGKMPSGDIGGPIVLVGTIFVGIASIFTLTYDILTLSALRSKSDSAKLLTSDTALELYKLGETYSHYKGAYISHSSSSEHLSKVLKQDFIDKTEWGHNAKKLLKIGSEIDKALDKYFPNDINTFKELFSSNTLKAVENGASFAQLETVFEKDGSKAFKDFVKNPDIYKTGVTPLEIEKAYTSEANHHSFYEIVNDHSLHKAEEWHKAINDHHE